MLFSPFGLKKYAPKLARTTTTRPIRMLHLFSAECRVSILCIQVRVISSFARVVYVGFCEVPGEVWLRDVVGIREKVRSEVSTDVGAANAKAEWKDALRLIQRGEERKLVVRGRRTWLKRVIKDGTHVLDVPVCHCEQCSMNGAAAEQNG